MMTSLENIEISGDFPRIFFIIVVNISAANGNKGERKLKNSQVSQPPPEPGKEGGRGGGGGGGRRENRGRKGYGRLKMKGREAGEQYKTVTFFTY